jgi:hypothetical protein
MFRNPELLLIETALLLFPMLLLAWMGWRSALSSHSKPKVLAFGLLATVPLCWVLGVGGAGHGGFAAYLPVWWVLIASAMGAPGSSVLVYPSMWLTPWLPIAAFAVAYIMRTRSMPSRHEAQDAQRYAD